MATIIGVVTPRMVDVAHIHPNIVIFIQKVVLSKFYDLVRCLWQLHLWKNGWMFYIYL